MLGALLAQHAPATVVAFGARGARSASDLARDAHRVAAALGTADAPDTRALLFVRDDRYAFAAALLGTLQAGYTPVVATDTGRETALALAPESRHVLHDTLSGAALRLDLLLTDDPGAQAAPPMAPADFAQRPVRLQGPDGSAGFTCIDRTLGQLLQEAEAIGQALDYRPGSSVVSGLPPGHPFGLTLGVLLPLLRGGAMLREVPQSPTSLASALSACPDAWLACVPAQLVGLERAGLCAGPERVCSMALLDDSLRARAEHHLGCPVDEIVLDPKLGSALVRRSGSAHFMPLPGVLATCDPLGKLQVTAAWLPTGEGSMQSTGVVVQAAGTGGFRYLGRSEDRCTLGGHTLCLPELDGALQALQGVDDALWIAPARGPYAGRLLLAAVAAPTTRPAIEDAARALIADRTKAPDASGDSSEPAQTLFMDTIPRDDLGAPRMPELLRRFGLNAQAEPLRLEVEWLPTANDCDDPGRYLREVRVPHDYAYFDGHFPGYPILPGAAQLGELVLPCVRWARPNLGPLTAMSHLKFLGRIQPGDTVSILVEWTGDDPQAEFSIRCQGKICAAGRLSFGQPD